MNRWLAALAASLLCTTAAAGPIQLVKDINATVGIDSNVVSTPRSIGPAALGSSFLLTICTSDGTARACNPWITDGTSAGAHALHRFDATTSAEVGSYATIGATGYFLHTTASALELWSTDGTAANTQLVASIAANWTQAGPVTLLAGTSRLYFSTPAGDLYTSDGTAQGTQWITTKLWGFAVKGDSVYFTVQDYASVGAALYESDGVNAPVFLKYINPGGGGSSMPDLTFLNGTLILWSLKDSATVPELWSSDGTSAGTQPITTLPASTRHSNLVVFGGKAYFVTAIAGMSPQAALWSTDGTQAGTAPVVSWNTAETPVDPVVAGGFLYFIRGSAIWRTDGSTTTQISTQSTSLFTTVGNDLYFQSTVAPFGGDVWKIASGASTATQVLGLGRYFAWGALGDKLLLGSSTAWTLDASGTLSPLAVAPGEPTSGSKCDGGTALVGSVVFFVANDGLHGCELWKTDGTASGTVMVKDLATAVGFGPGIANLTAAGGFVYFTMSPDGGTTYELWQSDGTSAGTTETMPLGPPPLVAPVASGNVLLVPQAGDVWRMGAVGIPARVPEIASQGYAKVLRVLPTSDGFYFIADTAAPSTRHVLRYHTSTGIFDAGAYPALLSPDKAVVVWDYLYFALDGTSPGLYFSDGSAAGTRPWFPPVWPVYGFGPWAFTTEPTGMWFRTDLRTINNAATSSSSDPGPGASDARGDFLWKLAAGRLYRFAGTSGQLDDMYDGTCPFQTSGCVVAATDWGAFFTHTTSASGTELWITADIGNAAQVEDFEPGPASIALETGALKPLATPNGLLLFASHGGSGTEPHFLPFVSTPDTPIAIAPRTAVPLGSTVISDPITPTGITVPLGVFASNGAVVCVSSTASCSCDAHPYAFSATLLPGQSVCVRMQAPSTPATTTTTYLNIGAPSYPFTTTTVAPRTISVALAGTGTGTVTSLPSGISCGTTCSTSFLEGTSVRLIATRNPGSVFTGWTGGTCSGTGDCVFTVSSDTTVTATFAPAPIARLERDFDGDGRSDLLLHSPGGTGAWLMSGTTITAAAAVTPRAGDVIKLDGDFNGDGRADLLFRGFDGAYRIALMAGLSPTSVVDILPAGTGWEVVAKGDFNGDGKTDLIWKSADGVYGMWLMDGTNVLGAGLFQSPGVGWDVQLIADFDGDGKSDILWRNADGRIQQWAMDGANSTVQATMTSYQNAWMPLFAGDFDGDGKADIVWTHPDGSIAVWLVDGTTVRSATVLLAGNTGWHVKLVADLDGDGKSDIVLQDENRGTVGAWLMNGNTIASAAQLIGPYSGWSVVASGDFNGDGRADLVWRSNIGAYGVWIMDGLTPLSVAQILGGGTGWDVVP